MTFSQKTNFVKFDDLSNESKDAMMRGAAFLGRIPSCVLAGPGDYKIWKVDPQFNWECLNILTEVANHGTLIVNPMAWLGNMSKKKNDDAQWHFQATYPNQELCVRSIANLAYLADFQSKVRTVPPGPPGPPPRWVAPASDDQAGGDSGLVVDEKENPKLPQQVRGNPLSMTKMFVEHEEPRQKT